MKFSNYVMISVLICLNISCKSINKTNIKLKEWEFESPTKDKTISNFFILNSILYPPEDISIELKSYKTSELTLITFIKNKSKNISGDIIVLIKTEELLSQEKQKILQQIEQLYINALPKNLVIKDWVCQICPILSINNKIIGDSFVQKNTISNLQVSDIKSMCYWQPIVGVNLFENPYKNGVLKITLN